MFGTQAWFILLAVPSDADAAQMWLMSLLQPWVAQMWAGGGNTALFSIGDSSPEAQLSENFK